MSGIRFPQFFIRSSLLPPKGLTAFVVVRGPYGWKNILTASCGSEEEFLENWHYIRYNPVKRELCVSPEAWPWLYESPERDFL